MFWPERRGEISSVAPVAANRPAGCLSIDQADRLICSLPEVVELDRLCQAVKDQRVAMTIGPEDDATQPKDGWWYITVGEDHPDHWLPVDRFKVNAVTKVVLILDMVEDVYVPLDRWCDGSRGK